MKINLKVLRKQSLNPKELSFQSLNFQTKALVLSNKADIENQKLLWMNLSSQTRWFPTFKVSGPLNIRKKIYSELKTIKSYSEKQYHLLPVTVFKILQFLSQIQKPRLEWEETYLTSMFRFKWINKKMKASAFKLNKRN